MSDSVTGHHETTILALRWAQGVTVAGDRRASSDGSVFHRTSEKLLPVGARSIVALSGTSGGQALDMAHRLQLEVEQYEKVNDRVLSLDGQANVLSRMLRDNLAAAMAGRVVIPILAGFDPVRLIGRIFSYDVTGGCWSDEQLATAGSGGPIARTVLKAGHDLALSRTDSIRLALAAIDEAADNDTATAGADLVRGIYPRVLVATAQGIEQVDDGEVSELCPDHAAGPRP